MYFKTIFTQTTFNQARMNLYSDITLFPTINLKTKNKLPVGRKFENYEQPVKTQNLQDSLQKNK